MENGIIDLRYLRAKSQHDLAQNGSIDVFVKDLMNKQAISSQNEGRSGLDVFYYRDHKRNYLCFYLNLMEQRSVESTS